MLVSELAERDLSMAAFCNQRGLRAWQFYEWKKRVKEPEAASLWRCKLRHGRSQSRQLENEARRLKFRLRTGRSLIVSPDFSVGHLRALMTVPESEALCSSTRIWL
jgi:hypothetical protein